MVAVDFTCSNRDPADPKSLHYYDRQRPENPYTMAIRAVGDIFQDYDYGRLDFIDFFLGIFFLPFSFLEIVGIQNIKD